MLVQGVLKISETRGNFCPGEGEFLFSPKMGEGRSFTNRKMKRLTATFGLLTLSKGKVDPPRNRIVNKTMIRVEVIKTWRFSSSNRR